MLVWKTVKLESIDEDVRNKHIASGNVCWHQHFEEPFGNT